MHFGAVSNTQSSLKTTEQLVTKLQTKKNTFRKYNNKYPSHGREAADVQQEYLLVVRREPIPRQLFATTRQPYFVDRCAAR